MKWKNGRQSNNVQDARLDPLPDIADGEVMFGTGEIYHNTKYSEDQKKQTNAERNVQQRGDKVPTPSPSPRRTIDKTQVTPGKWVTKSRPVFK